MGAGDGAAPGTSVALSAYFNVAFPILAFVSTPLAVLVFSRFAHCEDVYVLLCTLPTCLFCVVQSLPYATAQYAAATLFGGGTLVSWATGLVVSPTSSGAASGLQPWLGHALQPALQQLSPRVAAAAAVSGGAAADAAVLALRGLLRPLAFAAFATDTLVRNALRRGGVRGRVPSP